MIVSPLTLLTRKDQPFVWTDKCEVSFEEMKRQVTSTPVLTNLDTNKCFKVYYDVLYQGLGCVLMKKKENNGLCISAAEGA